MRKGNLNKGNLNMSRPYIRVRNDFYGIAGHCWFSKDINGKLYVISMSEAPTVSEDEAKKTLKKKTFCASVRRYIETQNDNKFKKYRFDCRKYLSKFGQVQSGMASCGQILL